MSANILVTAVIAAAVGFLLGGPLEAAGCVAALLAGYFFTDIVAWWRRLTPISRRGGGPAQTGTQPASPDASAGVKGHRPAAPNDR